MKIKQKFTIIHSAAVNVEGLTSRINDESRLDLLDARKTVLSKLDSNRKATQAVFEKGSLLQLADIGAQEYELALNDIDQNVFGYFENRMKVELGQPEFTSTGNDTFNVLVPVEWNLRKQPVLDVLNQYFNVALSAKNQHVGGSLPYSLSIKKYANSGNNAKRPFSPDLQDYIRDRVIAIKLTLGDKVGYLPLSGKTGKFGDGEYALQFSNDSKKNTMLKHSFKNPIVIKSVTKAELREATEIASSVVVLPGEQLKGWSYE